MFVAFGNTLPKCYRIQRVKFSALIYHISSATNVFLEVEQFIFGTHFPHI